MHNESDLDFAKVWVCEARRVLGVNPPIVRQTATKVLGFLRPKTVEYTLLQCVFTSRTEHLSYVAHTLRVVPGCHTNVSCPISSCKLQLPLQVDIGGRWTPSIQQSVAWSFIMPTLSLKRTLRYILCQTETKLVEWSCRHTKKRIFKQKCETAQPGLLGVLNRDSNPESLIP